MDHFWPRLKNPPLGRPHKPQPTSHLPPTGVCLWTSVLCHSCQEVTKSSSLPQNHLQDQSRHPACCASRPDAREETVRSLWQSLAAHKSCLALSPASQTATFFCPFGQRLMHWGEAPGHKSWCQVRAQERRRIKTVPELMGAATMIESIRGAY